jgi:hypothetical protein
MEAAAAAEELRRHISVMLDDLHRCVCVNVCVCILFFVLLRLDMFPVNSEYTHGGASSIHSGTYKNYFLFFCKKGTP